MFVRFGTNLKLKWIHNLYLKSDFLLLADMFKKFRNISRKNYGLCPNHYLSAPASSRDTMLNMKKVEPELISVLDMYIFFPKGARSGVSYISNRYNQPKNKYVKSYDPKQEWKAYYIL